MTPRTGLGMSNWSRLASTASSARLSVPPLGPSMGKRDVSWGGRVKRGGAPSPTPPGIQRLRGMVGDSRHAELTGRGCKDILAMEGAIEGVSAKEVAGEAKPVLAYEGSVRRGGCALRPAGRVGEFVRGRFSGPGVGDEPVRRVQLRSRGPDGRKLPQQRGRTVR